MRSGSHLNKASFLDRRAFLQLAGCGGIGLLATGSGPCRVFASSKDLSSVTRMEFDVIYRTQIHSLPEDAEEVHIWMPLPPSDEAQEVKDLSVNCPVPHEITREKLYGNRMVHVKSGAQPAAFTLESRYHIVRHKVGSKHAALDEESARKYLRLTSRVRVTDEIEAFTKRAVAGAERPIEVAQKVYDAIIELLSYDKMIPGCGTGDTGWIMKHKRGKCDDYHSLFMAMMISQGIPVRWEQGFPLPSPFDDQEAKGRLSGDCTGAHCWASFHEPSLGWVPVDVSEADKHPEMREFFFGRLTPNRFKISEGRSITLSPAQGREPLNTFAFAYAEADGIPLIYAANYENLIQYHVTHVEIA